MRDLPKGARPSYGRRRALGRAARVATVPVGYADGFPRAALDGGRRGATPASASTLAIAGCGW